MKPGFRQAFPVSFVPIAIAVLGSLPSAGCTGRAEAVRAAQPHLGSFAELRGRSIKLIELRRDIALKTALFEAVNGDEASLPEHLRPHLERMRSSGDMVSKERLDEGEAMFWRMFDFAFAENPNVLQGELSMIEDDGSTSVFRYPRDREIPAGVGWYGLRESRTFAGLANCLTTDGSVPCVLIQRRPQGRIGSAGLTVAYRREPVAATDDSAGAR